MMMNDEVLRRIEIQKDKDEIFISQSKYVKKIFAIILVEDCRPIDTCECDLRLTKEGEGKLVN